MIVLIVMTELLADLRNELFVDDLTADYDLW